MDLLIARVAYAFGSLLIPFAAIYFSSRKTMTGFVGDCWMCAFLLAWLLQTVVVFAVGESAVVTVPSALLLSAVALFHFAIVIPAWPERAESQPSFSVGKGWWALYIRLLVLYLPASLIFGALFGLVAEAFGLGTHAALSGAMGQIPASLYATYFAHRWLHAPREP